MISNALAGSRWTNLIFLYINVLIVGDPGHGSGETTFKKLNTRDNKNLLGWEWSLQNPAMTKS